MLGGCSLLDFRAPEAPWQGQQSRGHEPTVPTTEVPLGRTPSSLLSIVPSFPTKALNNQPSQRSTDQMSLRQLISPQNFLRRHCPQFQGKRQKRLPLGACYKDPHCSTDSYKQPLTTVASQLLTGHRAFVPELWPGPLLTAIRLRLVSLSNNLLREHPPGPACGLLNYV